MTHLAQIALDFATVARLHIRDAYDWHQRVWQCFPGRDGQQRDFLTRLDHRREGFRLLIVSPTEALRPDWCPSDPECWKTKPIPETYFTRRRYAFQLCANPTKKVPVQEPDGRFKKNGRREPLRTREELVGWIKRKGEQGGFAVDEDRLRTFSRGREYFEKNGMRGLHSAVEFQGVLTVTDPAKLHETFTRGVGSAKAFGFGLLVIAPVS
jgi:CRISPR system Cascade subunit CasE